MTNWIEWNGGECPIKSDKTRIDYECRNNLKASSFGVLNRWSHRGEQYDIIAYRIIEDHEPMTREQITAQIGELNRTFREQMRALDEQLKFVQSTKRYYWLNGDLIYSSLKDATHWIEVEIHGGVPVAATIKEVLK